MKCAVVSCAQTAYCSRYCEPHYRRNLAHGSPLGGRIRKGEPARYLHEVVLSHVGDACFPWPYARTTSGYGRLFFDGKTRRVSRVVCEIINGPPPTPEHQAAHSCGNGHLGCVNPAHLSWKDGFANQADRIAHGTHVRGERNGSAKLTEGEVREIRAARGAALQREIAARYGITQASVSSIQRGASWASVDDGHYVFRREREEA